MTRHPHKPRYCPRAEYTYLGVLLLLCTLALVWIGTNASSRDAEPLAVVECNLTTSNVYLGSGWKIQDTADVSTVGILIGQGRAERIPVDNLVECTRYRDGTTPVTEKYALVFWRKK